MARWRWLIRRPGQDIDPIGPATIFGLGCGSCAAGGNPTENGERAEPDPMWNARQRIPRLVVAVLVAAGAILLVLAIASAWTADT